MLTDDTIFIKTELGRQEIAERSNNLERMARQVLILADGQRTIGQVKAILSRAVDAVAMFEILADEGFIAVREGAGGRNPPAPPVAPAPTAPAAATATSGAALPPAMGNDKIKFATVKSYLIEFVNGLFGTDGKELVHEISNCKTLDELRAYGDVCVNVVASFAGRKKSEEFRVQLDTML